jgi:hypothetical protein
MRVGVDAVCMSRVALDSLLYLRSYLTRVLIRVVTLSLFNPGLGSKCAPLCYCQTFSRLRRVFSVFITLYLNATMYLSHLRSNRLWPLLLLDRLQ